MKYIANPVEVEAFVINYVAPAYANGTVPLHLDNGTYVMAGPELTSRYVPVPGDYWVIQSDGYVYLNPKAVLERKYRAV